MIIYTLLALIVCFLVFLLILFMQSPEDYLAASKENQVLAAINKENILNGLEKEFEEQSPFLNNLIGSGVFLRFIMPSFLILIFSSFVLGPFLTNYSFGILLGLIIALAYSSRLLYHLAANFRTKLLSQLERILMSIRNNLSTGATLDYAVATALDYNAEAPLGPHLARFIAVSETSFLENFPLWLKSIQRCFNLKELNKSSQLLALELEHSSNQEEAFINAASHVSDRITINRKQKNSVLMTFITMDFLVLAFFGVLFLVIPNIAYDPELSWWDSARRPLIVFISGILIWFAYSLTVMLTLWRQS